MLKIFIPSASRYGATELTSNPLRFIDHRLESRVWFVVPSDQYGSYRRGLDQNSRNRVNVIGCPERGIAATRHWIGGQCEQSGDAAFLMLDDDVKLQRRVSADGTAIRYSQPDDVLEMLTDVELALQKHAHVGVSPREGNNRVGVGGRDLALVNTRTLRALAYRTTEFMAMEHGRVDVMEDFDVNLQLLEAGHTNTSLFFWTQDQRMTNAPGGCSTYRTHAVHEASARRLAELHPGLVRLTEKKNKTNAEGFGTRIEVVISWKKAAELGQRRLAEAAESGRVS